MSKKIPSPSKSAIYHIIEDGHAMYYDTVMGDILLIDMYHKVVTSVSHNHPKYDEIEEMIKSGLAHISEDKKSDEEVIEYHEDEDIYV